MPYKVIITTTARLMMRDLKKFGKGTIEQVQRIITDLAYDPEGKTQPLRNELAGFRSLHRGRFRIIIKIVNREVCVYVWGVGWHESGARADVYQALARLLTKEPKP